MSSLNGEVIIADQSIGEPLQLRIYGDEFYARRETLDGYTVIYDTQQRRYCYATLAAGHFISTGVPVTKPPPVSLKKHLKEDPDVRNYKFGLRYDSTRPPEDGANVGLMRTLGPENGLLSGRTLHTGQVKGLTILVDFDDVQTNIAVSDVEKMFNSDSYSENGNYCSVKKYFEIVSSGKLTYTNLVVGPVKLSKRRSNYITNLLVEEAVDLVVNTLNIDLKQFDSKGQGIVDAINILYAGESQYDGNLWPHNSFMTLNYGDMRTHYYQLTGLGLHKVDLRIGTICHENGHLLCRFPDMYDYGKRDGDHEKSQGIGRYCLMGSGNHLNERRTPSPVCGYLRELAGWVDNVIDLNGPQTCNAVHSKYDTIMKFSTDKANEYFIVENRSRMGLDSFLPASGLAIMHCDTQGSNEWQEGTRNKHYQCALVQADGHLDLENNRNSGDGGDLFGGESGIVLSNTTNPSSREWDGTDSGLIIGEVSPPGEVIHFAVGNAQPPQTIHLESWPNLIIPDNSDAGISSILTATETGKVKTIAVGVEIVHSWISDLKVSLHTPSGQSLILHNFEGDDGDDIKRVWSSNESEDLQWLIGEQIGGDWTLHVVDNASADVGRLLRWHLDLEIDNTDVATIEERVEPHQNIPDNDSAGIISSLIVNTADVVKNIAVAVDIEHTFIGDLQIELVAPSGLTAMLHDREGLGQNNIKRLFDNASTPSLQPFIDQSTAGEWLLRVRDLASADQGQLLSWTLLINR